MQRYEFEDAVLKSDLSPAAQRILFIYASECIWKYGQEVYLSYSRFAEYNVSKRTRDEWVPKLRNAGWLRDTGRSAGRGGCDIYELVIPELVHESAPVPEAAPVELVQVSEELVQVSEELVQVSVGTSADSVALNSDTNTDITSDSNSEEQGRVPDAPGFKEANSSRELPTQSFSESSSGINRKDIPGLSGKEQKELELANSLIINRSGMSKTTEAPAAPPEDGRAEKTEACRFYHPNLSDKEIEHMVDGLLANDERARRIEDDHRRRVAAREAQEKKELTW